jgi:hypothetical protein
MCRAAEPIEFRDDDRAFQPAGQLESRGKLRPAVERVSALASLDLGESIYDVAALCFGEPGNSIALSFEAKPRGALLLGADPDIGDDLLHSSATHKQVNGDLLNVTRGARAAAKRFGCSRSRPRRRPPMVVGKARSQRCVVPARPRRAEPQRTRAQASRCWPRGSPVPPSFRAVLTARWCGI